MKNVIDFLVELNDSKLKLSERMGAPIITTAQRSEIKQGFMNALMQDLQNATDVAIDENVLDTDVIIGFTADSLVFAVAHNDLAKKGLNEIPFKIEVKVGNLDYDTTHEMQAYQDEIAEKQAKKEQKAKEKALKMAYDKQKRQNQLKAKGYETE